jgi:hypothetical protein
VLSCLLLCACKVGGAAVESLRTPPVVLDVAIVYPTEHTEVETDWSPRFTVQVTAAQGGTVEDARVVVRVHDPDGVAVAELQAEHRSDGTYLTEAWMVPTRASLGTWTAVTEVTLGEARGAHRSQFEVKGSVSRVLLEKYGFWLDRPTLCGQSYLFGEKGDARNGMIQWGGGSPGLHITPTHYVQVHWREGEHDLTDAEAAERFLLTEVGDLGDSRSVASIERFAFQHWPAWRCECVTYSWQETEWVVFYAPEVDKTYAIETILSLPPSVPCPHCELRDSLAVFPEIQATGVAPEPLPRLLPAPRLIAPPVGARFSGVERPIVLQWHPVKTLGADEYYEVEVDYYYREKRTFVQLTTRDTEVTLPETLYRSPNCSVFSWRATLKQQAGVNELDDPAGEALSYRSMYWYLWWQYPLGEEPPFPVLCPYTHLD